MNRKSLMGVLGIVFLDLGIVLIVNSVLDALADAAKRARGGVG